MCVFVHVYVVICVYVQLLAGASVNEKTKTGETALHLAAARDHTLIVSILVENGADVDAVDENHNNGKSYSRPGILSGLCLYLNPVLDIRTYQHKG